MLWTFGERVAAHQRPERRLSVAELCRVAEVSRNSLYRYHAPILKALREHSAPQSPRGKRHGPEVGREATCREPRIA